MKRLPLVLIALIALLGGCGASDPSPPAVAARPTAAPSTAAAWSPPSVHRVFAGAVLSAVSVAGGDAAQSPAVPCALYPHGGPVVPLCRPGTGGGAADALVAEIPGTNLRVNRAWADTIGRFHAAGLAAGFDLQGASQLGLDLGSHRSAADQRALVEKGFPAAPPGRSMHEWGLAVDWSCNGRLFGDPANEACRRWVQANASQYGLRVLGSEPWHWSPNGR